MECVLHGKALHSLVASGKTSRTPGVCQGNFTPTTPPTDWMPLPVPPLDGGRRSRRWGPRPKKSGTFSRPGLRALLSASTARDLKKGGGPFLLPSPFRPPPSAFPFTRRPAGASSIPRRRRPRCAAACPGPKGSGPARRCRSPRAGGPGGLPRVHPHGWRGREPLDAEVDPEGDPPAALLGQLFQIDRWHRGVEGVEADFDQVGEEVGDFAFGEEEGKLVVVVEDLAVIAVERFEDLPPRPGGGPQDGGSHGVVDGHGVDLGGGPEFQLAAEMLMEPGQQGTALLLAASENRPGRCRGREGPAGGPAVARRCGPA